MNNPADAPKGPHWANLPGGVDPEDYEDTPPSSAPQGGGEAETIAVSDLARILEVKGSVVIRSLMTFGVMATLNQRIDMDTAELVVKDMKTATPPAPQAVGEAKVETLTDLYWHITRNALKDGSPFATACMDALPALNAAAVATPPAQQPGEVAKSQPVKNPRHPIQPLVIADDGLLRFKQNAIVRFLLDHGGIDMNTLAALDFTRADREQFAQLIGYSHRGAETLDYISNYTWETALERYERRTAALAPSRHEGNPMTANTTKLSAPKGAMPEMPEAALLTHRGTEGWTREQVEADRRACYLAAIEAARECVPGAFTQIDYIKHRVSADEAAGHNHCRTETLANLAALIEEAKKK